MADQAQQPESVQQQVQRWLEQDQSPTKDVSMETSPEPAKDSEPPVDTQETEEDYQPGDNAQVEGDATEIRSVSDLAKRLEMEEDALLHLTVEGKDGKPVPLREVLNDWKAPRPEAAEIERTRARLTELEAGREDYARAVEELRLAAKGFAQRLQAQEPDWAALQQRDPQAFLAKRLEWMEHERRLEITARQYEGEQRKLMAEQQRKIEDARREEAQKLKAAVPAWKDDKAFSSDLSATEKYLLSLGYPQDGIMQISDHRDWLVADKARRWDELQSKKPAALEKVKQLPKVVVPGASSGADRGAGARRAQQEAEAMERLKSTGSVADAAELIGRRMENASRRAAGRALAAGRRP